MYKAFEKINLYLNNYEYGILNINEKINNIIISITPEPEINYNGYLFIYYWYMNMHKCKNFDINDFQLYVRIFNLAYSNNEEMFNSINGENRNKLENDRFTKIWLDIFDIKKSNFKKDIVLNGIKDISKFINHTEKSFNDLKQISKFNKLFFNKKHLTSCEYKQSNKKIKSNLFGNIMFLNYCEKFFKKIPLINNLAKVRELMDSYYVTTRACF